MESSHSESVTGGGRRARNHRCSSVTDRQVESGNGAAAEAASDLGLLT